MKKLVTRFRLFQFLALFGILFCSAPAFAAFANYTSMVNGGQRWLKSTQNAATYANMSTNSYTGGGQWEDDGYSSGCNVSTTSFAVSALIDTGIPKSDQHVIDGINYILSQVHQDTGMIYDTSSTNYDTGSALIALSVYGDPPTDKTVSVTIAQYRAIVKRAADYVIAHQATRPNSSSSSEGSWSYHLESGSIDGGDMSNTQFGIMGIWYAYNYLGLQIPPVEMVYASPAGGVLTAAQTVWLSNLLPTIYAAQSPAPTADIKIYYTTDGSNPTTASAQYDDNVGIPISVSPTVLKFFYVDSTVPAAPVTSAVKTLTYTIDGTAAENVPQEYPFSSKLYGYILRCQARAGGAGNISYLDYSNYYSSTSMTGAGLWGLVMVGMGQSPAALKAVDWFNTNYTWAENIGRGGEAYYYSIFGMAKALTGAIGPDKRVGDPVTGHLWSQDLTAQMYAYANFVPPNVYWVRGGWLDGGKNMATAWVLLGMAFTNIDQPSPQKIVAPGDIVSPIPGNLIIKTEGGILIDSVKDDEGNGLPFKVAADANDATTILPVGGLHFKLINVPVGGAAELSVVLPSAACDKNIAGSFIKNDGTLKGNVAYYKLANGAWKGDPNILIIVDPVQCALVVTLVDGGAGDQDGIANGTIVDPGAAGLDVGTVANALRALRISVGVGDPATVAETADLHVTAGGNAIVIADALWLLQRAVGVR